MENWKTWVLASFVALGGIFEVIKHAPQVAQSAAWEMENLNLPNLLPYSIREGLMPSSKKSAVRPAQFVHATTTVNAAQTTLPDASVIEEQLKKFMAENEQTETEFDADGKPIKKKKKHGPDWEEVIDPETGKKVWRKKKKDGAEEVAAQATGKTDDKAASDALKALTDAANANKSSADIQAAVDSAADGGPAPKTNSNPVNHFNTLQDWQSLLLTKPDLDETTKFIDQYKQHLVTDDVFYKIVNAMLTDPRTDMRSLGVLCAGETPSTSSFEALAGADKTLDASDKARVQVEKFLDQYAKDLSYLPILQAVLKSSDTHAATLAAQKLDASAKTFLVAGSGSTGGTGTQSTGPANASDFKPFEAILQGLTQSSDSNLTAQATATLNDLRGLLGETSTGSTATASAEGTQAQ